MFLSVIYSLITCALFSAPGLLVLFSFLRLVWLFDCLCRYTKRHPPLRVVKQAAKTDAIESIIKGGEGGRLLSYVAGHKKCPKNSSR